MTNSPPPERPKPDRIAGELVTETFDCDDGRRFREAAVLCAAAAYLLWSAPPSLVAQSREQSVIVVQSYADGITGVHSRNPDVKLSVGRDPELADELVLFVDYPQPTGDPAGRDIWCDAERTDWTAGNAISFWAKPAAPLELSVSFLDRNRVAYTAWAELQGGAWQRVLIPLEGIRPNPYFQPPDAKAGSSIDVSDVRAIGFAPQDRAPGRLAISRIVVVR